MFNLECDIRITDPATGQVVRFNYVTEIEVVTSILNFTDTAKIVVPRKLRYQGKSITDFIKRNHTITILIGYGNALETVFKGYVKSVSTGTPINIECENESWKLKQIKMPATRYASLDILDFCNEQMANYTCRVPSTTLGEVRIAKETTLAKVFEYFMSNYPVHFYFRDDTFYGILPGSLTISDNATKTIKFRIGYNTVSDNLNYTLAEDVKLQIIAKAVTRSNTKLEYKTSEDSEGAEVRTFLVPGATTVAQLKDFANARLNDFKIDKMEGDFTALGQPYVRKGDIVHLFDEDHEERNNKKFFAEAVTYGFGQGGYKQKIKLGAQIHV
jgi:hypothetical protein